MSQHVNVTTQGLSLEMKRKLKGHIEEIKLGLANLYRNIDRENDCLLCEFESLNSAFREAHTMAATYYLRTYLLPFTDNHLAITLAVQHLSERRHGALMVVERNDRIDDIVHSGIPVGATLTHSLLESIFYPGGPLHDGAVLIKSNLIVSASNVLPVSTTFAGESKLGTRHRAAIGLSEHSDALVLVVSEETGNASFALGGKLYPFSAQQFAP
ncbi:sporulation-specific diadenylate cyclase CdaS [Alicyclobacillus dauci]|uniref:Diadenylate cyclase n=1 Tax=Alicyclobacillus dauci TaxID=1475485 RepID=A0ABY6Z9W3_9BACL|nr:sporulation-specific diadenylate cyclase CdaS [Alicyclobacillus dauci]WAH38885.1 sporulation-specific diadenylate cyclase CdaS [Alicyclobacillus dauci]